MTGNLHKNKLWILAKKLNYIPDNYDIYANKDMSSITRGKIFEQSSLYMFHSIPEEAMALVIMSAQLRRMKIQSKDEYNGKSLWEMYEVKEVEDDKTKVKYYDAIWKDDYVRQYINTAPEGIAPNYEAIKGLTTDEIRKMKYMYQRMHGGYRADEKTYLEYFVLGEIFMQFKRYLPNMLRLYGQSRSKIQSYGYYKPKTDTQGNVIMQDGKQVVEWHSRVVEGRFITIIGLILNAMAIRNTTGENLTLKDKFLNWVGVSANESYKWENLPEAQKELLIDFGVTMSMWLGITMIYLSAGGGVDDDKDPFLKFTDRIAKNFVQNYNIKEAAREVLANGWPSTFKVFWYKIQSISELTWSMMYLAAGEEDKALTRQGTLHGTNQFIKYWMPYGGSYYDFVRLMLGEENVDEYTFRK